MIPCDICGNNTKTPLFLPDGREVCMECHEEYMRGQGDWIIDRVEDR